MQETAELTTPFHTQGICDKTQARTHYLGGREVEFYRGGKFQGTTTNQDTYTRKQLPGRLAHQAPARPQSQPFNGTTTYSDTYIAHPATVQKQLPPPVAVHDTGRFDAKTTYVSDYPGHNPELRQPAPQPSARPQLPFEGTSTYRDQYPPKTPEPRMMKAGSVEERPRIPFDASSEYQKTYHAHELPTRQAYQAPPAPRQLPFDGTTTNRDTYVQHQLEPRSGFAQPVPPESNLSSAPFDATTTYGDTYLQHQLPERRVVPPLPPRTHVPFDATTSNRVDFVPHALEPRLPPPNNTVEKEHIPFDGTTTNTEQYKQWPIEPRVPPTPPPMRATVPFEGTTTSRDAFRGWKLPPSFPAIGLEILGDRMHTLIPRGAPLPARGTHIFSTVHDNQQDLCVLIYAGNSPKASENELLGQFDLSGLPMAPKNSMQIEITFKVDEHRVLSVVARDLNSHRQYQWLENGHMMARTLNPNLEEVHGSRDQSTTMYPSAASGIAA